MQPSSNYHHCSERAVYILTDMSGSMVSHKGGEDRVALQRQCVKNVATYAISNGAAKVFLLPFSGNGQNLQLRQIKDFKEVEEWDLWLANTRNYGGRTPTAAAIKLCWEDFKQQAGVQGCTIEVFTDGQSTDGLPANPSAADWQKAQQVLVDQVRSMTLEVAEEVEAKNDMDIERKLGVQFGQVGDEASVGKFIDDTLDHVKVKISGGRKVDCCDGKKYGDITKLLQESTANGFADTMLDDAISS